MRTRAIYGCAGVVLSAAERDFFRDVRPWGFILFGRNIENPDQVRTLTAALRETLGDGAVPILIDQEGGRVARLKPPHWHERPPAARFGAVYAGNPELAREATYLNARLIAHDLLDLGINVDCLPVLDVPVPGAHDIIGDRAFATNPAIVIDLGRAQIEGLMEGGVLPVMKHIPGHGRAGADSHLSLPRVAAAAEELSASDFVTFRSLDQCPIAMTAHVVYDSIDPQRPATTSPKVIRDVIRGEIGFDGLLMSDDLSMKALDGSLASRAKAALFAGCDIVLHCNGDRDEMTEVAKEAKMLDGVSLRRAQQALSHLSVPPIFCDRDFDPLAAEARLAALLAGILMSDAAESFDNFELGAPDSSPEEGALVVTVDGFEGPLDLLLTLARNQKVDIAKISIIQLADQYLLFIEEAKRINLELAADYLVMAAWLAYLKSRLVLPQEKSPEGEPSADEMATRLRWRLQRLDAMRAAATRLMGRERLDRDVFGRGEPEPVNVIKLRTYKDSLYDLLTAYATDRVRRLGGVSYKPTIAPVLQIEEARERLERMLGKISDWSGLASILPPEWQGGARRRSAMASTLLACLELARDGKLELSQGGAFEEIYVRERAQPREELAQGAGA